MPGLISVVVPTFNYGAFLRDAIESVLAQTYSERECIVVDNGSTDNTAEVLASFGSAIRVLHEPKRGPSAARNAGIRAARGELIAFLDADDRWAPHKLEQQMAVLNADRRVGAAGCRVTFADASGRVVGHRDFPEEAGADLTRQLRRVATREFWVGGSASGALVRRAVFDETGAWDETLPSAEDWDLWMRIAARHLIRNVPARLVTITLHGTGSWRDPAMREGNQWRALSAALERWPQALAGVEARMRALVLADVAEEYAAAGQRKIAIRKYLTSLRYAPGNLPRWRAVASLTVREVLGR